MNESVRNKLVQAGAIFGADPHVPTHFGDPINEQRGYEASRFTHYLGPIGVVSVSGPDRLTWLTTLSSQVVTGLQPDESRELLLLDHNGRIEFAAGIIDRPETETSWLILERNQTEALTEFLESMKFMLRVQVTDDSDQYTGFARVREPVAGEQLASAPADLPAGTLIWNDPWPGVEPGGARYYQGDHPGEEAPFAIYLVPTDRAASWIHALSGSLAGSLAAEATRIAAWRPRTLTEVDERTLPAELDWLRTAVHLEKGCYRGQESVARITNLGKPPRRLTFLQLDGSRGLLPAPGDAIFAGGRQVGVLTSVARHEQMGPIALALLKRNLDPSAQLVVGEVAAAQEIIVPADGRSDHSPASRPGAGLKRLDHGGRDIRTTGPGTAR